MFDGFNNKEKVEELFKLMVSDPNAAANKLDTMADSFKKIAQKLRDGNKLPYNANPNAMADKVSIALIGPDGKPKHNTGEKNA